MIKKFDVKKALNQNSIWLALIALCIFVAIMRPVFLTPTNITNLLQTESIKGIMTIGVMFTILSRGIDLSTSGVLALSSVVSASLVQEITATNKMFEGMYPVHPIIAVAAGLAVGVGFGLFNGALIAYAKLPAFIATLGTMLISRALAQLYTNAFPVPMLSPEFRSIGQGRWIFDIPNSIIAFLIVLIIGWFLLTQTRYGKNVYAIGGNEVAARVAGVNVEKNIIKVYMWSSTCAAFAGILIASRVGSGNSNLGYGFELDAIAAATVGGVSHSGGVARMSGVIAGIFLLGVVNNGLLLLGVSPYIQNVVRGLIIIGAVMFDMRKVAKRA